MERKTPYPVAKSLPPQACILSLHCFTHTDRSGLNKRGREGALKQVDFKGVSVHENTHFLRDV